MKTCYVVESGWIFVGDKNSETDGLVYLQNGAIVRSWSNGLGIGGIASTAHNKDYVFDLIGNVNIRSSKILFEIPCGWSDYPSS